MNIRIICIGKLKESYWRDAVAEYSKRLGAYCNLSIVELKEARLPANASAADETAVKEKEGESILAKIGDGDFAVTLEIEGKELSSTDLAYEMEKISMRSSTVDFIIGGSLGLSDAVKKRADMKFSFGRITLPHQLARVVLLEQIYRAFKINSNETYHK